MTDTEPADAGASGTAAPDLPEVVERALLGRSASITRSEVSAGAGVPARAIAYVSDILSMMRAASSVRTMYIVQNQETAPPLKWTTIVTRARSKRSCTWFSERTLTNQR